MMQIIISPAGEVRCVYAEAIDLHTVGAVQIRRASHVEPDGDGRWRADLSPVDGPTLGPFDRRSTALEAEAEWLTREWPINADARCSSDCIVQSAPRAASGS